MSFVYSFFMNMMQLQKIHQTEMQTRMLCGWKKIKGKIFLGQFASRKLQKNYKDAVIPADILSQYCDI